MTDDELVDAVVHELQAMATAGEDVPAMLRRVQQMVGREDCKLISVQCFRALYKVLCQASRVRYLLVCSGIRPS